MDLNWHKAIKDADLKEIRELIVGGADIDAKDRYGQTAIMLAARDGRPEIVELLIQHGAALNVTAKHNLSALMLAVVNRHVEVARLLARAGADLTIRGTGAPGFAGKTAHDLAAAQGLADLATELRATANV